MRTARILGQIVVERGSGKPGPGIHLLYLFQRQQCVSHIDRRRRRGRDVGAFGKVQIDDHLTARRAREKIPIHIAGAECRQADQQKRTNEDRRAIAYCPERRAAYRDATPGIPRPARSDAARIRESPGVTKMANK